MRFLARNLLLMIAPVMMAGAAAEAGVESDLAELSASAPQMRVAAASRLRLELKPSDLPVLLKTAETAPPRVRDAIVDILVARRDLGVLLLKDSRAELAAIQRDLCIAAFLQSHKSAAEIVLDNVATVGLLSEGLGDSTFVECTVPELGLDQLIYESRRARLLPYWLLIDPAAPALQIRLPQAVGNVESVTLDSLLTQGVELHACGKERAGDRTIPHFLMIGGKGGDRGCDLVAKWFFLAKSGTGLEAKRAAENLLTLSADPMDAVVVGMLATNKNASGSSAIGASAIAEAICSVPARGAALLCEQPRALDAFLTLTFEKAIPITTRRVLDALAERDASGREIDSLLLAGFNNSAPAARAGILASLAQRKAKSAAALFFDNLQSPDSRIRTEALAGLYRIQDSRAIDGAWSVFLLSNDLAELRLAISIIVSNPGALRHFADSSSTEGPARAAMLGAMLYSREPELLKLAFAEIPKVTDAADLSLLSETALDAARAGNRSLLMREAEKHLTNLDLSICLVAAAAQIVKEGDGDRVAERLLTVTDAALVPQAFAAAGKVASTRLVKKALAEALFPMPASAPANRERPQSAIKSLPVQKLKNLGLLFGSHLMSRPRNERNAVIDSMTASDLFTSPSLDDLATIVAVTGRTDFVMGAGAGAGRGQVGLTLDRAPKFPLADTDR
ncbi:MAG: hypothetical protein ACKVS6_12855 [Planctomycetota bacterium]